MVHQVRAISVDADRHHLRAFGMPTDTGSANDATAAVPYKTDDQMPDDSQNSHSNLLEGVDTKSPEALAHSGKLEIPEGKHEICLASVRPRQISFREVDNAPVLTHGFLLHVFAVAPTATIEAVYPNRQSDNSQLTQVSARNGPQCFAAFTFFRF